MWVHQHTISIHSWLIVHCYFNGASHRGNHKESLANLSRYMMMLQTGGVAIFPVNRTSESRSTINIDFPPLLTDYNPSPTTISRIASRWWLDPQQKSMKVRNIHTSVNLDYHATGQCVERHQIGRERKRHVMIGISKGFVIWLLRRHVQLSWTNERIKVCILKASNKDAYFMQVPVQQKVFSSLDMISNIDFHEQRWKHVLRQLHIIQRQMTIS